nr:hypothetical protein [Nonomuraea cypriaca]
MFLQEGAQLGAGAVDLVAGDEVDDDAVEVGIGEQADGQFALGGEGQVEGQAGGDRRDGVGDLLGGDPLAGADQRVPGPGSDVGQVDGVDAVVDAACAAHVLTLDTGCGLSLLLLAGLVQRADGQAGGAGDRVQSVGGVAAYGAHRPGGVPAGAVQQALGGGGRAVPGVLGDRPAVAFGQVGHDGADVFGGLQAGFDPGEHRGQCGEQVVGVPLHAACL